MTVNPDEQNVWQIPAGDEGRSYADVFLRYGVALIGPGDPGPWQEGRLDEEFEGGNWVRRFATEVRCGDVMLLRSGRSTVQAVGVVAEGYDHREQFDDVNGWDLQHTLRVRWCALADFNDFGTPVFPTSRLTRVRNPDIIEYAARFMQSEPMDWQHRALPPLPEVEEKIDLKSLPIELASVIQEIRTLAEGYWNSELMKGTPREREAVAHLVVPLLRALGWSALNIAVEWRNIDVSVFSDLPRDPENCRFVIEAKRLGNAIEYARDQATDYASKLGTRPDVIVTDGLRYRMYDANSEYSAVGYANAMRLKKSALEMFSRMRPA